MQNHYRDELTDFHNVCDDTGVPAGNTGLRVRWLVERAGKRKDAAMNDEQIAKRAEEVNAGIKLNVRNIQGGYGGTSPVDIIAAALREARDGGLEEAAKVAHSAGKEATKRWEDESVVRQPYANNRLARLGWDIASAIRKLKGADHEG